MTARLLLLLACVSIGCKAECEDGDPAVRIDLSVDDVSVQALEVMVRLEGESYARTFEIGEELADGETSLVVELGERAADFDLEIEVLAQGMPSLRGGGRFSATPDACNRFAVRVETEVDATDAGAVDAGDDAGLDGGAMPPSTQVSTEAPMLRMLVRTQRSGAATASSSRPNPATTSTCSREMAAVWTA